MNLFKRTSCAMVVLLFVCMLTVAPGCGDSGGGGGGGGTFTLTSTDITNAGTLALTFASAVCGGNDLSPQLTWTNAPDGTQNFAITVLDTDAANFIHWLLYNVPATVTSLDQGAAAPAGSTEATNDYGAAGYGGPCPPTGETHSYQYTVWSFNVADISTLAGFDANDSDAILTVIQNNATGSATITVTFTGT